MNQIVRVADDTARVRDEPVQLRARLIWHDPQPPALALDLERNSRLEHLVQQSIDVLPQVRRVTAMTTSRFVRNIL